MVGALIGVIGSFISSSAHDIYTIIAGNVLTGIAVCTQMPQGTNPLVNPQLTEIPRTQVVSFR